MTHVCQNFQKLLFPILPLKSCGSEYTSYNPSYLVAVTLSKNTDSDLRFSRHGAKNIGAKFRDDNQEILYCKKE